jgi:hypothetical protein
LKNKVIPVRSNIKTFPLLPLNCFSSTLGNWIYKENISNILNSTNCYINFFKEIDPILLISPTIQRGIARAMKKECNF